MRGSTLAAADANRGAPEEPIIYKSAFLGCMLAGVVASPLQAQTVPQQTPLTVTPTGFALRGAPFRIISGELEYSRIPRELWRDRLQKARALGLNAVTVYVFWNLHEQSPGVYDFSGQNDVAAFIREAQQQGLYVILRPGPYACAEWDLGAYPSWLLRDPAVMLRSLDPRYMAAVTRWMHRLAQELAPLQADRGGPILAVQVENEYGSFGHGAGVDRPYLQAMYALIHDNFSGSLLYTADGADVMTEGSLPGVFSGIDFGTGDASRSIALAKKTRPGQPIYVAEYWDGWFDHWGEKHQVTDAAKQVEEVRQMLAEGDSLSLYMVHGGTSWGWMNGANNDHGNYQPDVSSYDYDAPLDESGRPREKYFALRKVIAQATGVEPPPVPSSPPPIAIPEAQWTGSLALDSALPTPVDAPAPEPMEDLGQSYGWMVLRAQVQVPAGTAELSLGELHSYARVYLDGKIVGILDRRLLTPPAKPVLTLHASPGPHQLELLVENTGRINFTTALRDEWAGMRGPVTLAGDSVGPWQIFPLPFTTLPASGWTHTACTGACLYQGSFSVSTPGDTFLDTSTLGKGVVWVNGHLLGRFWEVGPMGTLYLPGVWLHPGQNQITVMDVRGRGWPSVRGVTAPIYLQPRTEQLQ